MKKTIIINNEPQLQAILNLIKKNNLTSSKLLSGEITFKIDLFEFLHEDELTLCTKFDLSNWLAFVKNDNNYITYIAKEKTLIEHICDSKEPLDGSRETVQLSDNKSVQPFKNEQEQENSERAFLYLLNKDLSHGYFSEDVSISRQIRPDIYFSVFGEK